MPGKYADGTYGRKPWQDDGRKPYHTPIEAAFPPQDYLGPFQSNQDRLLNQALATWTMTSEEVQEYVRPNLPQVNLFPDRYGFVTEEIGIRDIIDLPGRSGNQAETSPAYLVATNSGFFTTSSVVPYFSFNHLLYSS